VGTTIFLTSAIQSGKSKRTAYDVVPASKRVCIDGPASRITFYWARQSFQSPLAIASEPPIVAPAKIRMVLMFVIVLSTVNLLGDVFLSVLLQSRMKWDSWRRTRKVRARYLAIVQGHSELLNPEMQHYGEV
jgi:hypothetical protein